MSTSWHQRLRNLRDAASAGLDRLLGPELPDPEKVLEAERQRLAGLEAARRSEALARLAPFAGHIVLVTDNAQFGDEDEVLARLIIDLDAADFTRSHDVFGVSAHLDLRRGEGSDYQINAMAAISATLQSYGKTVIPDRTVGVYSSQAEWLSDMASSAAYTCHITGREPGQVGQIAVVSAVDMLHNGMGGLPYYGEAFLLHDVTPDATPPITMVQISIDPHRYDVEGR